MQCSTSSANSSSASTSDEILTFRYVWPLKIAKRLINTGEKAILHVSPPFCTAYNGCQFTWILRMCDEHVLEMTNLDSFIDEPNSSSRVNVTLYYKNGPTTDITLHSASIFVTNFNGKKILKDTQLDGQEYTLGSGWSPTSSTKNSSWNEFSNYVHNNVGTNISVCVELKIKSTWFQPLNYLPSLNSANFKLEFLCEKILKEIFTRQLIVPDEEIFDKQKDKFAYHRHVYYFACQEIEKRLDENIKQELSTVTVQTVFAHIYFNHVIMAETACFEDFVDILEASVAVHFPALKRECERFICREVMVD
uniref:MATH domain-containing protein n=1 Tax=Panagrolaimus sp. JU765 TaxID=591449 RepID=A0AC34RPE6_9BILA